MYAMVMHECHSNTRRPATFFFSLSLGSGNLTDIDECETERRDLEHELFYQFIFNDSN